MFSRAFLRFSFVLLISFMSCFNSYAAKKIRAHKGNFVPPPGRAELVADAETGKILHQKNANLRLNPASLTKLMTIYLAFEAIDSNKISFKTVLKVSNYAASRPRSNIALKATDRITLREAILALIVHSANDAAVVIAEGLAGGSEEKFAQLMNQKARKLGMNSTTFANASGWHHQKQKTTAVDMAKLAIALKRDFPHYYDLFTREKFFYKNRTYVSHNRVTRSFEGAEGLKTGYTSHAGWNLVTTAKRDGSRLVGVILGGSSAKERDKKMVAMLENHFKQMQDKRVYANNQKTNKIKRLA